MGRKFPSKGGSRHKRKTAFRPQDPFNTKPREEDKVHDRPPVGDEGVTDIPEVPRNAIRAESIGANSLAEPNAPVPMGKMKRRKLQRREAARAAAGASLAGQSLRGGKELRGCGPLLPEQKPGESRQAYMVRLNKSLQEQLRQTQRKVTSDEKRKKMRDREKAKKEARKQKLAEDRDEREEALIQTKRPRFGEVVERPPILSSAALKSRSKLKTEKMAAKPGASSSAPPSSKVASDLSDYAAKVREAYEALKKRRQAAGGR